MDLKEILSRYPSIRELGEADNNLILDFYNDLAMEGTTITLRSDRSPDFFRLLRCQSDRFKVFGYFDGDRLTGLGSFSSRPGYVHGAKVDVNYACDLRLKFKRDVIRHWRSFYSDLLKHAGELSEFGHSPYFYTSVIDENEKARKALTGNKSDFEYSKVAGYSMVNIFFRWPFAVFQKPSGNHRVRRAKDGDLQDLEKFMEEQQKQKSYGFRYGDGELRRRFDRWPGFSIKSFILAFDEKNKIVGAFAPWATEGIKSNVIEKYPFYMRFIGLFKKIPKFGEPLKVTYLTHMDIDMSLPSKIREQIFSGMLNWYYRQKELPHVHMISFCDYEGSRLQTGIKGFCFQTIPMTLYSVGVPGGCHFESREAGFEMALV